mmetsp:Transcript_26835/g.65126  ORF Transcript_26835/g.65126 Transcript_26835/m.65126 type:complete len:227 (+) Transcript_26835:564-1244(+)
MPVHHPPRRGEGERPVPGLQDRLRRLGGAAQGRSPPAVVQGPVPRAVRGLRQGHLGLPRQVQRVRVRPHTDGGVPPAAQGDGHGPLRCGAGRPRLPEDGGRNTPAARSRLRARPGDRAPRRLPPRVPGRSDGRADHEPVHLARRAQRALLRAPRGALPPRGRRAGAAGRGPRPPPRRRPLARGGAGRRRGEGGLCRRERPRPVPPLQRDGLAARLPEPDRVCPVRG